MGKRKTGYFDEGKGRLGFAPLDRCYRDRSCALRRGHGGRCDPQSEPERFKALRRALDQGLDGDALAAAMEAR